MTNLTRILNNQIYSKTIIASQKIADGTITGSLFSSNVTVPGDLLISGNLFVLGTSAYTTIASTNTYVNDPLITLNNGFSGVNTYDEGLVFNRGSLQNRALIWSEFNKEFRLIGTTETGTTYGNVAVSNFANLHIGNLTVDYSITHTGDFFTNGFINTTANISAAVGVFGAVNSTGLINTTGNLSASQVSVATLNATGLINTLGNISASQGSFATINATGLINTLGNLSASTINAATVNTSGNVLATVFNGGAVNVSGNVSASTVLAQLVTADDATFGNVAAGFVGNTGTAFTGASLNVSGNVLALNILSNFITADDAVIGNISASVFGNVGATFTGATINLSGNVLGGLAQFSAINSTPIGNATASTGAFTTLTASNVSAGFIGNTGTAFTGASLNVSGNILSTGGIFNALTVNGTGAFTTLTATGNVIGGLGQFAALNATPIGNASASTGAFTTLSASQNFYANASIATTTQGTGAVVVPNGGISVAGAANIAGAITTAGATQLNSTLGVGGISTFTNTTNATDATGTTGALRIAGGASIAKDLWVGGNLYAANIIGIQANVITVQDPLVFFKPSYTFPYNYDIGFYSAFTGSGLTTAGNVLQHTAIVRNESTNTWTFASNLAEPGAGHVVFNADTVYDPIKAGNLELVNTTASTTTGTGALIVAGGAGIGGALFVGSTINTAGNVLGAAGTFNALTVNGTVGITGNIIGGLAQFASINATPIGNATPSTGVFTTITAGQVSSGFIGNTGTAFTGASLNVSGNVLASTINASTLNATTLTATGNIIGGLASFASINATPIGNASASTGSFTTLRASVGIWGNSTTASTNTTTGALVLAGGLGLAGNIFMGGAYLDSSSSNYILAPTPTSANNFSAATTIFYGAAAGDFVIRNPIVSSVQGTLTLFNANVTTLNFASAATTLVAGATSGVAHLRNANIWVPNATTLDGSQTGLDIFTQTATNANVLTRANVILGGNVGITTIQNPTVRLQNASNIWVGAGTLAFANAGVTTMSIGGDATTMFLGATTGETNIRNGLDVLGVLYANSATESTTTTNGGLVVFRGAGIGGSLNVANSAVFNNGLTTGTFQVKSSTSGNVALFANLSAGPGTSESVIIGGANTVVQSGVTLKVGSTTTMMVPVGPSSTRPSSIYGIGYDVAGMVRFNSSTNVLEFYDGTSWVSAGAQFTVISDRQFSGNVAGGFGNVDGTNTNFTLQSTSTTSSTIVSINGIMQFPTLAYSVSGTTLTFTEPPAPGDIIGARILTTTSTISAITNTIGYNQILADNTGASVSTGIASSVQRLLVDTGGNINVQAGSKLTYDQTPKQVIDTNLTLLDRFGANTYTTAKYVVSIKQDTGNVQAMESLVTTNGYGAWASTSTTVNTGNTMGTLVANVSGGTCSLWLIPNSGTAISNVKVFSTYIV